MIEHVGTQEKLHLCGEVIGPYAARRLQRTQVTLDSILPDIVQRASDIRSSYQRLRYRLIPEIVSHWKILRDEQDEKNKNWGHLFNPLASIPISEPTHSRLLGDLLDPNGSHSQGRVLLEAFLERIGVPAPKVGDWMISIEVGGVDICLWRASPCSVILIENKCNGADDQPNQLYRYWYEKIEKRYPRLNYALAENKQAFQVIYLPSAEGKLPSQHSLQRPEQFNSLLPNTLHEAGVAVKVLTFRDHITAWLDSCDHLIPPTNERLKTYLQFYKKLWS
jgi:hypothetical protein